MVLYPKKAQKSSIFKNACFKPCFFQLPDYEKFSFLLWGLGIGVKTVEKFRCAHFLTTLHQKIDLTSIKPILVIKFGTASITHANGEIDEQIIQHIADQVATLSQKYRIILVSSGAVGAGRKFIPNFKAELSQKKAAAAIGNPILMGIYMQHFQKHHLNVAQSLCERGHFANRSQFLQLKETYETLWSSGAIPIANENDVVSDVELKFSDNDELATLLAAGFGAETLMFSTSVGGFLDGQGKIIPQIKNIDESVWSLVDSSKSSLGLGGMASKLSFAQRAGQLGIRVIIFAAKEKDGILKALDGKTGTEFSPQKVNRSLRQKWMSTGSLVGGKLYLDEGAVKAIQNRKSLLAVGIVKVEGTFHPGETVELFDPHDVRLALAQTKISSHEILANLKTQKLEVAHADYIVVL